MTACELPNREAADIDYPNEAMLVAVEQAANIGDSNAAMLVAAEQAADVGDSNAAMLVAISQNADLGYPSAATVGIEQAAAYGGPEDAALACYFGPC